MLSGRLGDDGQPLQISRHRDSGNSRNALRRKVGDITPLSLAGTPDHQLRTRTADRTPADPCDVVDSALNQSQWSDVRNFPRAFCANGSEHPVLAATGKER